MLLISGLERVCLDEFFGELFYGCSSDSGCGIGDYEDLVCFVALEQWQSRFYYITLLPGFGF